MLALVPVKTDDQVEWLRIQRSRPELYRYFRQDKPISAREQQIWWKTLNHNMARLYIIENDGDRVGYVGFNPFARASGRAEFGLFIIPEHQHEGHATGALKLLLKKGFSEFNLSTIYSDVLDYPHENRFEFYHSMGFEAFPHEHQHIRYKKQGEFVNSIKFFMTKDMWNYMEKESDNNGKNSDGGLESPGTAQIRKRGRGRPRKN